MTGLPFVVAAWISNKKLPDDFIQQFNEANAIGLNNIDAVIEENRNDVYDLKKYFTQNISYTLDEEKLKGMDKFLAMVREV
jgi:chorismate dehydratase